MDLYEESLKRKIEEALHNLKTTYGDKVYQGHIEAYEDALETYQRIKNHKVR